MTAITETTMPNIHTTLRVLFLSFLAACGGKALDARNGDVAANVSIPVHVATVTEDSIAQPVTATGVVALRDEIALSFKIGGVVAQVLVREGESVRAGQLLATLDLREID